MKKKALLHLYLPDSSLLESLPRALRHDVDELWVETDVTSGALWTPDTIHAAQTGKIVPVLASPAGIATLAGSASAFRYHEASGRRIAIRLEKPVPFPSSIPGGIKNPLSVCLIDDVFKEIERNDTGGLKKRLDGIRAAAAALRKTGATDLSVLLFHPDPVVQLNGNRFISRTAGVRPIASLFFDSESETSDDGDGFLVDSAVSLSPLLCNGISEELLLRPSLTVCGKKGSVQKAVLKAKLLLAAMDLRPKRYELISCPTCGRCLLDLSNAARSIKKGLESLVDELGPNGSLLEESGGITVAVMGCNVNGPGEASGADIGVAGGKNRTGTIFKFGKPVKTVAEAEIVPEMIRGIKEVIEDRIGRAKR
ncbi:MAG: flavodoxin-dependent (E)-4-hydroxy-3-methylbut-2-enyl-diphosphate synthase [Spirochaetes bacterium]|nr:flavodoxin-dependent (E)-4-hydroxy-3-methylbut-2-enyl-diphosphate synthase [Spirochaetota bacterium]